MKLKAYLQKLNQYTKLPRGVFTLRYMLPKQNDWVNRHRKLFVAAWLKQPMILYFPLELIAVIRWRLFQGWWYGGKVFKAKSKQVKSEQGVSYLKQIICLLRFVLYHGMFPSYVYRYRLHQADNMQKLLQRFYNNEIPALHDEMNKYNPHADSAKQLVADKKAFADALIRLSIPAVVTEKMNEVAQLFQRRDVFIKPNTASCSRGAGEIRFDRVDETYRFYPIHGNEVSGQQAITALVESLQTEIIIQQVLYDHPGLLGMSQRHGVTTYRMITQKQSDQIIPLHMQIEIPLPKVSEHNYTSYQVYPLGVETFAVMAEFAGEEKVLYQVPSKEIRTYLRQALGNCVKVHHELLDLATVAFDVVITHQGALILEANYSWGPECLVADNQQRMLFC